MEVGNFSHCVDLEQQHRELKKMLQQAHGADYTKYFDDLQQLIEQCDSYIEFGIMQGGSLGAVLLAKPDIKSITAVDIKLKYFNQHRHLFDQYARDNHIKLDIKVCSSIDENLELPHADMLFIDSLHKSSHLQKELDMWGKQIRKFIVLHDTHSIPSMHSTAKKWATANGFTMAKYCTLGCGHTIFVNKESGIQL